MRSTDIDNIKDFTSKLFIGNSFDNLLVTEASFSTFVSFSIDGHLNKDFMGEEASALPENAEGTVAWKKIRPICFEMIKGRKVPSQFRIIFKMPAAVTARFLRERCPSVSPDQVGGLFLNVGFREGKLTCVTGSSMKTFSMDRSLETEWDDYMAEQLKKI